MHKKWEKRIKPNLNHLLRIDNPENAQLCQFILGHLVIESILVQLIDTKLADPDGLNSFRLSFPQKIELCLGLGLIKKYLGNFLIKINEFRNKYAHRLDYKIEFDTVYSLVQEAGGAGIEFTDDVDRDAKFAREAYSTEMLISTLLSNTAHILSCYIHNNGGEYSFG